MLLNDNHVCLIRNLEKFYTSFTNTRSPVNHICRICLTPFKNEDDQKKHTDNCTAETSIKYPKQGDKVGFQKTHALYPTAYAAFLDLEALNVKLDSTNNPRQVSTQHAFVYHYKIMDLRKNEVVADELGTGPGCVDQLLTSISNKWENILKSHSSYPLHMTQVDEDNFQRAKKCEVCETKFSNSVIKVRHHFHYKEKNNYAGALCNRCNLAFKDKIKYLPVLVHNLTYDMTLILKQASSHFQIDVNKKQGINFYSGQYKKIKFMDSLNMIKGSLSALAREHIKNKGSLRYTKNTISHLSQEAQSLLIDSGKQYLPYEYLDSMDKLNETSLPAKSEFYSSLTESGITDEEYAHVIKVWDSTGCETLMDYLKLYLRLDVALLADVYLQWRQTLLELFDLDCLYFLTLASYAIEAFYYKTKVKLDCISDENLYQTINRNIRGGFCSVGKRHVKANNRDINPNFKVGEDKSNYLLYIDFNSLYPTCMSKYKLPMGDFREMNGPELEEFLKQDLSQIDTDGDTGYFIHCDTLPISPHIIEKTDSFPLCMSKKDIKNDDLSTHSRRLLRRCNRKLPKPNKKLVAHHLAMKDHLISLPLLQFLLQKGLEIKEIHRVYSFRQGDYLKEFIDNNIEKRSQATNPFIKNALKLINNAIYGRSLLNPLNYATNTKVCQTEASMIKSFSKPTFKKVDIISPSRSLVTYNKAEVLVNSPIYIGFSILDYAKLTMYKFWYDVLVKEYGDRVTFVYSDTDSFVISLESDDIANEIKGPLADHLDLSNFPPNHPLYNDKYKGHLGKLKIETAADYMSEFVALRPKMYSFLTSKSQVNHNTLKGIPNHIRQKLTLEQYKECLYENIPVHSVIHNLRFYNHDMSVIRNNKLTLSSFEDKRFYDDSTKSYGYGHPKTLVDMGDEIDEQVDDEMIIMDDSVMHQHDEGKNKCYQCNLL